ncbi:MAG: hypothetical protein WCD44_01635 [Candidatus Babeliales bacterium]|jgi:ABC-type polysaccharide/polyol phosphate export permease
MNNATNIFTDNFTVFWALLQRDLFLLKKSLRTKLIDGLFYLIPEVITFGYLMPLLGMPLDFIPPLFVGAGFVFTFFIFGYSFVMPIVHALNRGHILNYQLTLPIPKRWLLAEYVTYFVIETTFVSAPLIIGGIIILGPLFTIVKTQWLLFLFTYLLVLVLFGLFFLHVCFNYERTWFRDNLWARRLSPLCNFSTILFSWAAVKKFSPVMSILLLFNPITYATEGLRAALLGGEEHLSLIYSLPALFGWILFFCWQLARSFYKRLDPV